MYEDYGNLAGFASFAGATDTSDVPVVRYQDLHRSHAPASAGAMAVYQNPTGTARHGDFEENLDGYGDVAYGDVAYGEAHEVPPEFAGIQPLPIPTHVPAYGRTYGAPTADDVIGLYPDISKGSSNSSRVKELQDRLVSLGYMTQADVNTGYGVFGSKTEAAVKKFQKNNGLSQTGSVNTDTWLRLYGLSRPSSAAAPAAAGDTNKPVTTTREAAEEQEDLPFWRAALASAGLKTGRETEQQPVAAAPTTTATPIDWQKVAIWGGVAVGGILLTVVVVKALKD